jgi:hypothetical protein
MSCDGYETGSAFKVAESISPRSLNRTMRSDDGSLASFDQASSLSSEVNFLQNSLGVTARSRLGAGRSGVVVRTMHGRDEEHFMLIQSAASFFLLSEKQIKKVRPIE